MNKMLAMTRQMPSVNLAVVLLTPKQGAKRKRIDDKLDRITAPLNNPSTREGCIAETKARNRTSHRNVTIV
jgi:hypothetical protein